MAEAILRYTQSRADDKGVKLDVGDFPRYTPGEGDTPDDPERLSRLLAHAVARSADRFPIFRKVSRHLEGTETRAGLASDLAAVVYELYNRNSEEFDRAAISLVSGMRERAELRRINAAATGNGGKRRRFGKKNPKDNTPGGVPSETV